MQLIAIGESLKKLDAITSQSLLSKYPQIEWKSLCCFRLLNDFPTGAPSFAGKTNFAFFF